MGDITLTKKLTTFEREMLQPKFKAAFEEEYKQFILSELIVSLMENDKKSVRQLAIEVGLSPTVIQKIRSGLQNDIKLQNFINIITACGYHLMLEKGSKKIRLS